MTGFLAHTDAARRAIAAATTVLGAKALRDKGEALRQYGIVVKDERLVRAAVEFKLRAERRLGELIAEMKARGEIRQGQHGRKKVEGSRLSSLEDAGISRDLSSRAQRIAKVPEKRFEEALAESSLKPRLKLTPLNGRRSPAKPATFDFHGALARVHDLLTKIYDASTAFQREQLLSDLRAFLNTIGSTKR